MNTQQIVEDSAGLRRQLAAAVAACEQEVTALARAVHADPEQAFAEQRAAAATAAFLREHGFAVTTGVGRLATAVRATSGTGEIVVAVCVEYDALPGLGHACGHHLILGAGLAAAAALAAHADELGITVTVLGTPAEEHGGGKIYLLQDGAFDDAHCAIMIHPVSDGLDCQPAGTTSQAVGRWRVTYTGKASHAAAAPHLGVNAADAAVVAQVAVGLLRQQLPGDHRANVVVLEAGDVTNIICARSVLQYEARAYTMAEFEALDGRLRRCFEAGALATGCDVEIEAVEPAYEPLRQDEALSRHWCDAFGALGRHVGPGQGIGGGSTDFGNVSQVLPGLHPWVSLPGVTDAIHSAAFATAADTDGAYETMLESAVAMAWAIAGLMGDEAAVAELRRRRAERVPVPAGPVPGEAEMRERTAELA